MTSITRYEVLKAMAKGLGKPVLEVRFPNPLSLDDPDAVYRALFLAAPWLADPKLQLIYNGSSRTPCVNGWQQWGGYVVCEDEEECNRLFNLTVGDNGPTSLNSYAGTFRVYCLTSMGQENT